MRFLILVLSLATLPLSALAFLLHTPDKGELLGKSEFIAVVQITRVQSCIMTGENLTYRQKALATVERTIKGKLPKQVVLSGNESHRWFQTTFVPGRYLVFLTRDKDLLVSPYFNFSVMQINKDTVEWYAKSRSGQPGSRVEFTRSPLSEALQDIAAGVNTATQSGRNRAK